MLSTCFGEHVANGNPLNGQPASMTMKEKRIRGKKDNHSVEKILPRLGMKQRFSVTAQKVFNYVDTADASA
jgi:hypothetical protein